MASLRRRAKLMKRSRDIIEPTDGPQAETHVAVEEAICGSSMSTIEEDAGGLLAGISGPQPEEADGLLINMDTAMGPTGVILDSPASGIVGEPVASVTDMGSSVSVQCDDTFWTNRQHESASLGLDSRVDQNFDVDMLSAEDDMLYQGNGGGAEEMYCQDVDLTAVTAK
ncbi:hypothetical protein MN608_02006 [Microdochium nivale]|nr:hypothetical protein MN608_02006 [Microdochium nivale]